MTTILKGVREYRDGMRVELEDRDGREVLVASADAGNGFVSTRVDLLDLLHWLRENRPELLESDADGARDRRDA